MESAPATDNIEKWEKMQIYYYPSSEQRNTYVNHFALDISARVASVT